MYEVLLGTVRTRIVRIPYSVSGPCRQSNVRRLKQNHPILVQHLPPPTVGPKATQPPDQRFGTLSLVSDFHLFTADARSAVGASGECGACLQLDKVW